MIGPGLNHVFVIPCPQGRVSNVEMACFLLAPNGWLDASPDFSAFTSCVPSCKSPWSSSLDATYAPGSV